MSEQIKLLRDLQQRIHYIETFTQQGEDFFFADLKTQEAVIRSYEVIGEIVKRLEDDLLEQYPQVAWKRIKGFRDFLIHNYDEVDLDYVWDAVEDLPNLKTAVEAMLKDYSDDEEE